MNFHLNSVKHKTALVENTLGHKLMIEHRVSYKENIYMTTTPLKSCHLLTGVEPHSLITDFTGVHKTHQWKMRDWKTRHQMTWVENVGLVNAAPSKVTPQVTTSCLSHAPATPRGSSNVEYRPRPSPPVRSLPFPTAYQ